MIRRRGPVPYSLVVESALYGPGGFYEAGGRAGGREGDFVTSPETGPLFGVMVGRALDREWERLGRPDPFVVVEAGAGPGTLARMVLAGRPACAPAMRYVLVERSARQRSLHGERLSLEQPALAFAPRLGSDGEGPPASGPPGPIVVSVTELPRLDAPAVVLANELLDNLAFDLAERTTDGWAEVRVALGGERSDLGLVELLVELEAGRAELLDRLAPSAVPGARAPLQEAAQRWLRDALDTAGAGGAVLVVDYAATTAELAGRPWLEWVRTYRAHRRGGHPLEALGLQDVTCEVASDQLSVVRPPERSTTQAEWLTGLGIESLVAAAREEWSARAGVGDLRAVRARSLVGEAAALTDLGGLGAFRVLEWR